MILKYFVKPISTAYQPPRNLVLLKDLSGSKTCFHLLFQYAVNVAHNQSESSCLLVKVSTNSDLSVVISQPYPENRLDEASFKLQEQCLDRITAVACTSIEQLSVYLTQNVSIRKNTCLLLDLTEWSPENLDTFSKFLVLLQEWTVAETIVALNATAIDHTVPIRHVVSAAKTVSIKRERPSEPASRKIATLVSKHLQPVSSWHETRIASVLDYFFDLTVTLSLIENDNAASTHQSLFELISGDQREKFQKCFTDTSKVTELYYF